MEINNYSYNFEEIKWNTDTPGKKHKFFKIKEKTLTLVEFNDKFVEEDWCKKGHFGFVIEGEAEVLFYNGDKIQLKEGDIINIPSGEADKHKTEIQSGKKIVVLFIN